MVGVEVGIVSVFVILFLIYTGVHVAVALGLVSFIGVWVYRDSVHIAVSLLAEATHDTIAHTVFANVPLFALMGIISSEIGLGSDVYRIADQIFRRVRGGLGMAGLGSSSDCPITGRRTGRGESKSPRSAYSDGSSAA